MGGSALAQLPVYQKTIAGAGGGISDGASECRMDAAGNVFTLGLESPNSHLSKFDPAGNLLWSKDIPVALGFGLTSAGNIYVLGNQTGSPTQKIQGITYYNGANGAAGGTANILFHKIPWFWDTLPEVKPIPGTDSVIVSSCDDVGAHIYKISNGSIDWEFKLENPEGFQQGFYNYAVDSTGHIYTTLTSQETRTQAFGPAQLIKITPSGTEEWRRALPTGGTVRAQFPIDCTDGLVTVGCNIVVQWSLIPQWLVTQYTSTGTKKWERGIVAPGSLSVAAVKILPQGDVMIAGDGTEDVNNFAKPTILSYRLSGVNGAPLWSADPLPCFVQSYFPERHNFTFDNAGNLYTATTSRYAFPNGFDLITQARTTSGNLLWRAVLNNSYTLPDGGVFQSDERAQCTWANQDGDVVTMGDMRDFGPAPSLFITKYQQATNTISPNLVLGGRNSTVTIKTAKPALRAYSFTLSSNTPGVKVPTAVTLAKGASACSFIVSTTPTIMPYSATVTATCEYVSLTNTVQVVAPKVIACAVTPTTAKGGTTIQGSIALNGPAPAGGLLVLLWDNNTSSNTPFGVTVAPGATTATFRIATDPVTSNKSVTVSASTGGGTKSATFTLTP